MKSKEALDIVEHPETGNLPPLVLPLGFGVTQFILVNSRSSK